MVGSVVGVSVKLKGGATAEIVAGISVGESEESVSKREVTPEAGGKTLAVENFGGAKAEAEAVLEVSFEDEIDDKVERGVPEDDSDDEIVAEVSIVAKEGRRLCSSL